MLKAVVYDFDGTLTPETKPEFKILEKCGMPDGTKNPLFFATVREKAAAEHTDIYDAMAQFILSLMQQAGFQLTDENIALGANQRVYNPGVEEFLANLHQRGIDNFLLSSGLQSYLKHLKIAPDFTEIFATVFSYDQNGEVNGITRVMSADEKAVALREIAEQINGHPDDFSGIIYIGDGPTDVIAMEYIKQHGGGAVLIQHDIDDPDLPIVDASKADLVTIPDFTAGGELAKYIDAQIS